MVSNMAHACTNPSNIWKKHAPLIVLIALVTYFWWPSLWRGQVIIHSDAAHHGYSLLVFLHEWLQGTGDSLLWFSDIYGGHPLFAESQGGFLNPLNLISAYLFEPKYGVGILHWMDMLVAGFGVYTLCRILEFGRWSALFAAIAASYSGIWLGVQFNTSVSGALAWTSWTLAAAQYWFKEPSITRALIMAVPATLLIYSGYPHLAHGVAIYLACFVVAIVLTRDGRVFTVRHIKALLLGGVLAVLLALLLSAVQLVPLIELVLGSHRGEGTPLAFGGLLSAQSYISGMLFFDWSPVQEHIIVTSQNSLLVCLLAFLCVMLRVPFVIIGHMFGTFLLLNLGMEYASPVFRVIYDYHLIPGLHGYRIMHPFFLVAVIGLSVLAAYALSSLSAKVWPLARWLAGFSLSKLWMLGLCIAFLAASYFFFPAGYSWLNFLFPTLLILFIVALVLLKRNKFIPMIAVLLLVVDVLVMRSNIFNFYEASILDASGAVQMIRQDPDYGLYRTAIKNASSAYVFIPSNNLELDKQYSFFRDSLSPFPVVISGVPSIDGVLALTLQRRQILESEIEAELRGGTATMPGQRVLDSLGVRYVSFRGVPTGAGLDLFYEVDGVQIYRNKYALPKYRTYSQAESVAGPAEALSAMTKGTLNTLYVETDKLPVGENCKEAKAPKVEWLQRSNMRYVAEIDSRCSGWLYVGDAFYPGWRASINGQVSSLYPAQVLGKAVYFPAGRSLVELSYWPASFYISAVVSCMAWLGLLVFLFVRAFIVRRPYVSVEPGEKYAK